MERERACVSAPPRPRLLDHVLPREPDPQWVFMCPTSMWPAPRRRPHLDTAYNGRTGRRHRHRSRGRPDPAIRSIRTAPTSLWRGRMGARLAPHREADECVGTIGLMATHVLGTVGVGVRRAGFAETRRVGERLSTREHFTTPLHRVGCPIPTDDERVDGSAVSRGQLRACSAPGSTPRWPKPGSWSGCLDPETGPGLPIRLPPDERAR